jgi:holo-[acyl-carrier protein] synthase
MRVGIDLVDLSRIAASIDAFGDRFLHRVFTDGELAYAQAAPALTVERLAARFAAKEAAKKALDLEGVGWRDLEVARSPSGACHLILHGAARVAAGAMSFALSMSHEGDHATAVVIAHD